nr:hypothetical protein Iba_scaffold10327CG0160 [Ipomoea batatas]
MSLEEVTKLKLTPTIRVRENERMARETYYHTTCATKKTVDSIIIISIFLTDVFTTQLANIFTTSTSDNVFIIQTSYRILKCIPDASTFSTSKATPPTAAPVSSSQFLEIPSRFITLHLEQMQRMDDLAKEQVKVKKTNASGGPNPLVEGN